MEVGDGCLLLGNVAGKRQDRYPRTLWPVGFQPCMWLFLSPATMRLSHMTATLRSRPIDIAENITDIALCIERHIHSWLSIYHLLDLYDERSIRVTEEEPEMRV